MVPLLFYFSFQINIDHISENLHILHKCDNRRCVRPDHLFLGTNYDNVIDKVNKNRQAKGSESGNVILNENEVIEIKYLLKNKYYGYIKDISEKYNVSSNCINDIRKNRTWKHV
jgi:hypothetical protein